MRKIETIGSPDYDFRHHLYDTLILLGAKKEMAALLKKSMDFAVTEAEVDALRRYNIELMTATKTRLVNLNSIKVRKR